jgi:uncharacterized protein YutD
VIFIANKTYELVVEHKNGWKPDAFKERYSEVLERYDYIVGDWGYNQLRLRGFFKDNNTKVSKESSISTLQDYLNEYCNFGCAYFIIEKVASSLQMNELQPDLTEEGSYDAEAQTDKAEPTLEQPQLLQRHQYQPQQKNQEQPERQQNRPQHQGQRPQHQRKNHNNQQRQNQQNQAQPSQQQNQKQQQQQQVKQQGTN